MYILNLLHGYILLPGAKHLSLVPRNRLEPPWVFCRTDTEAAYSFQAQCLTQNAAFPRNTQLVCVSPTKKDTQHSTTHKIQRIKGGGGVRCNLRERHHNCGSVSMFFVSGASRHMADTTNYSLVRMLAGCHCWGCRLEEMMTLPTEPYGPPVVAWTTAMQSLPPPPPPFGSVVTLPRQSLWSLSLEEEEEARWIRTLPTRSTFPK